MDEADVDIRIFFSQMMGQMFGTIDRTMLPSCATETDHQTVEASFAVSLHMRIHDSIHMI
jgi:hypothetical protein